MDYWLTERYCLYTLDERGTVLRGEIHHPPWPLRRGAAKLGPNTMTAPFGIPLDDGVVLHYSERQDVLIWPLTEA